MAFKISEPKKVYGVGYYADNTNTYEKDTAHERWLYILERCYSGRDKYYSNSEVCDNWLCFDNFSEWYHKYNVTGCGIDKDIIKPGNTIYAPEFCAFVPEYLNIFARVTKPGKLLRGVERRGSVFRASVNVKRKQVHSPYYHNEIDAHCWWQRMTADKLELLLARYRLTTQYNKTIYDQMTKYCGVLRQRAKLKLDSSCSWGVMLPNA